jgi:cytidylate kinase
MNVITVSRQYGAGGYEVARHLAEALGWELLDRELLHRAAAVEQLPDAELERPDEKAVTLADRFRLHPPHQRYLHGLTEAARQAAARGKVVLVGRGTGQLIPESSDVLHLRLTAPKDWRARRMARQEGWSFERALARCTEEDRARDRFIRYFFGQAPFRNSSYALTVNTGRVPLGEVVAAVVALVRGEFRSPDRPGAGRVLTLSRELDAGDSGFAPTLGQRLGLRVYDRALLEQESARGRGRAGPRAGRRAPLRHFQTRRAWQPLPALFRRAEAADEGVGGPRRRASGRAGGGSALLRDFPRVLHVYMVAPEDVRVRRVMEHRWLREGPARELIAQSAALRSGFYRSYFDADWSDPLEYHLTVNSGRLGPAAVELVAYAAEWYWAVTPA